MKVTEILWDEKYAYPIYVLENGQHYRPDTAYAGYYINIEQDRIVEEHNTDGKSMEE